MRTSSTRDNLFAGDFPIVTEEITLAQGQDVKRGAVLVLSNDSFVAQTAAITVGDVVRIAAEDVDATLEEVVSVGYITGQFNKNAVIGLDLEAAKNILADKSIYLVEVVRA